MKRPTVYGLSIALAAGLLLPAALQARPVDFKELSLLVRAGEPEASVRDEVGRRKLMHPLTDLEASTLKGQGASDSLIKSLRTSAMVASKEDAAAAENQAATRAANIASLEEPRHHGPHVHVFNVAYGHPINLSQWGGADYEIAFFSYRVAGEDYVAPAMIDNVRTGTDVSRTLPLLSEGETFSSDFYPTNEVRNWRYTPYEAHGDMRDNRFNFSDSVATTSRFFSRPLPIDWSEPVFIEGQPYTFYRVYGGGGVALYYIGRASDSSAMVAVVSWRG